MAAWKNATAEPRRGVVGRARSASLFDLNHWAPTGAASEFVEHFWSVSWDLRGRAPFESTVITFSAVHLTREWGADECRHGCRLPATLLHGVVTRVFCVTIHDQGTVVGARFRPGGYAARFRRTPRHSPGGYSLSTTNCSLRQSLLKMRWRRCQPLLTTLSRQVRVNLTRHTEH